jgi:hypothetical protein
MIKKIRTTQKAKIAILQDHGISADDSDCIKEFDIWSCSFCHERYPISAGNCYDDMIKEDDNFTCFKCGRVSEVVY